MVYRIGKIEHPITYFERGIILISKSQAHAKFYLIYWENPSPTLNKDSLEMSYIGRHPNFTSQVCMDKLC